MLRFRKLHPHVAYEELTDKYHSCGENKVMDILMEMKSKDKEILILYYVEGYSCKEIKELLKISDSAVKKDLREQERMLKSYMRSDRFVF